jgi:hypothetical protein
MPIVSNVKPVWVLSIEGKMERKRDKGGDEVDEEKLIRERRGNGGRVRE